MVLASGIETDRSCLSRHWNRCNSQQTWLNLWWLQTETDPRARYIQHVRMKIGLRAITIRSGWARSQQIESQAILAVIAADRYDAKSSRLNIHQFHLLRCFGARVEVFYYSLLSTLDHRSQRQLVWTEWKIWRCGSLAIMLVLDVWRWEYDRDRTSMV